MPVPFQRIHLADDGSEHAAWMLHYALRMASRLQPAAVQVLHVEDGERRGSERRRLQHQALAQRHGVTLTHVELNPARDVATTLARHVPAGPDDVVVVGFRAHERGPGLAFGSVGHALLSRHDHAVLAMRVVEPGNMGLPRVLALGLSESPGLAERMLPAVQLFAPDLEELWLLRVVEVQRPFLGAMTFAQARAAEVDGQRGLSEAASVLRRGVNAALRFDQRASVSDRWPSQLVMDAHRAHAHLLLLGASDHLLPAHFTLANPLETVLRNAACDVAVFRAAV